jgi:peptidoglycan/LPS O-acetylase OafA/YrhL
MTLSTGSSQQPASYFPALTGIRAISAFLVYVHHFHPFSEDLIGSRLFRILREAHIGVSIFFVLSGFLIAYRYYGQTNFNFKKYLINRVARIYPVYFALTLVTFILNPEAFMGSYTVLLLNISFLRGFFEAFKFTGIAPGWSLTVEETFYFTAPIFFYFIRKSKLFLIGLPLICLTIGWILVQIFSTISFHGFFGSSTFMLLYTFLGRSIEFFTGISLAIFFMNNTSKIKGFKFTLIGLMMLGICLTALAYFSGETFSYGVFHPMGIWINNLLLPLTAVAVLFYGLLRENTWFSRFLSTPTMELLGKSSYIFYLIHMGIISNGLLSISDNLIFHFIALNLVSILLFKFFEDPLNHYIRQKFSTSTNTVKS